MAVGDSAREILMKLVLKGIDPGEAQRIASASLGTLENELRASLSRQTAAHQAAGAAATEETKKQANAEIREATAKTKTLIGAIQSIERETKRAANANSTHWRRTMEDLENFTVVATGAWQVIAGGAARFKGLGDEAARVTNIYGSLKGSIDAMREATGGQIADIDLITTKNRAAQKELQLTEEQFALVAAGADSFADALGTDTKDALDQLIDGLATGRTKMLASAGVVVDTEKAYEDYGRKIDRATKLLSEHDKKVAVVEASLRALNNKVIEAAGGVETFADNWEKANAQITNLKDEALIAGGTIAKFITDLFLDTIPTAITTGILAAQVAMAKLKDIVTFNTQGYAKDAEAILAAYKADVAKGKSDEAAAGAAKTARALDAKRRDENPRMADLKMFGGEGLPFEASGAVGGGTKLGKGTKDSDNYDLLDDFRRAMEASNDRLLLEVIANGRGVHRIGDGTPQAKDPYEALENIAEIAFKNGERFYAGQLIGEDEQKQRNAGLALDQKHREDRDLALGVGTGGRGGANPGGDVTDAFAAAQGKAAQSAKGSVFGGQDPNAPIQSSVEQIKAANLEMQSTIEMAGGAIRMIEGIPVHDVGLFERMLFGPDGPQVIYDQMTEIEQQTLKMSQSLQTSLNNFGHAMAGAVGQSIALAIGEGKNLKQVLKDTTHQVLMSLAAEAAIKALTATAKGVGALAGIYSAGLAPGFFAEAAAWGAVTAAAGIGARATYSGGGAAAGSTPTASRAPSTSSGSSGRDSGEGGGNIHLTINAPFGDEVSIGRSLDKLFFSYEQQTGRKIGART